MSSDSLYAAHLILLELKKKAATGNTRQDDPAAATQQPTHAAQAATAYHAQTGGAK